MNSKFLIVILFVLTFLAGVLCNYDEISIAEFCKYEKHKKIELDDEDNSLILKLNKKYQSNKKCSLIIKVDDDDNDDGNGILLAIRKLKIRNPNDRFQLTIDSNLKLNWVGNEIDDQKEEETFVAKRQIKIEFWSSKYIYKNSEFELILTSIKRANRCGPSQFNCGNNNCVKSRYECDLHNNCGNNKDEKNCSKLRKTVSILGIIFIVFFGSIISCFFTCLCCYCCCSRRRIDHDNENFKKTHHRIHSLRQSRIGQPVELAQEANADEVLRPSVPHQNYGSINQMNYPLNHPNFNYQAQQQHYYDPPPPYSPSKN